MARSGARALKNVVGHLGQPGVPVARLDGRGDPAVELGAGGQAQLVVQHLAHEGMDEREPGRRRTRLGDQACGP